MASTLKNIFIRPVRCEEKPSVTRKKRMEKITMKVHYVREGEYGRIVLSNPPDNSLDSPVFADREELIDFFEDECLKGVVLTGDGRHFCSGADPDIFALSFADISLLRRKLDEAKALLEVIRFAPVPVVAAIRGSCLGAGLEIALCCHFRFAAKSAMFGFPESSYGLLPGMAGTVTAQKLISRSSLMELIFSGRLIGAEEACQLGLADQLCRTNEVLEKSLIYLEKLTSAHPPRLIRAVMEAVHNGFRLAEAEALRRESELFCCLASPSGSSDEQN